IELRASIGTSVALVFLAVLPALLVFVPPLGAKVIGVVLTAALLALAVAVAKRRLLLDERGVTAKRAFGLTRLEWNEVDHYTYWSMDQRYAYAAGGQGAIAAIVVIGIVAAVRAATKGKNGNRRFAQGQLVLVGKNGVKVKIDNRYRKATDAL